jgi:hypothetical protein
LRREVGTNPESYLASVVALDPNELLAEETEAFAAIKSLINDAGDKEAMADSLRLWAPGVHRFVFDPG